ncbi:MAG: hypothetical protein LE180_05005 [Endomicrobium sp.]|uniref:hypothetical protein n=1 Tax=Candidatus Endomicrobiellum pyrsonymphae TaxID=1408203 RepID=UPI003581F5E6|nr:hypothetical protein [Endomicrobium sp.]
MFVFISSALVSVAVERKCVNSYKEVSESILYVNMSRVFKSYPKTQGHKKEIQDFAKTLKTVVTEMVKEFNFLKDKARSVNSRIKDDNLVRGPLKRSSLRCSGV